MSLTSGTNIPLAPKRSLDGWPGRSRDIDLEGNKNNTITMPIHSILPLIISKQ